MSVAHAVMCNARESEVVRLRAAALGNRLRLLDTLWPTIGHPWGWARHSGTGAVTSRRCGSGGRGRSSGACAGADRLCTGGRWTRCRCSGCRAARRGSGGWHCGPRLLPGGGGSAMRRRSITAPTPSGRGRLRDRGCPAPPPPRRCCRAARTPRPASAAARVVPHHRLAHQQRHQVAPRHARVQVRPQVLQSAQPLLALPVDAHLQGVAVRRHRAQRVARRHHLRSGGRPAGRRPGGWSCRPPVR